MSLIVDEIKKKEDIYYEEGVSLDKIEGAEKILGLKFAAEYKEYLQIFGSVSCSGHELTGFSEDIYLDVVKVTIDNRKKNPNVEKTFYVIEETHIDGIVIWQDESGKIYQADYKAIPKLIYDSFTEYVKSF